MLPALRGANGQPSEHGRGTARIMGNATLNAQFDQNLEETIVDQNLESFFMESEPDRGLCLLAICCCGNVLATYALALGPCRAGSGLKKQESGLWSAKGQCMTAN
jgi:hypothetical protein